MKVPVLLALVLLFAQEKNAAEETFKKIEEKLLKSESIRVEFKTTYEQQGKEGKETGQFTGSLLLQGEKARLETRGRLGERISIRIISDGKSVDSGKEAPVSDALPMFGRNTVINVARFGAVSAVMEARREIVLATMDKEQRDAGKTPAARETDAAKTTRVKEFKAGPSTKIDGRDAGVIQFVVEEVGKPSKTHVTLWFDALTLLPIRRRVAAEDEGILVEESYGVFTVNEKIDASKFELPGKK